jgi:nitrogenase-associated protein
VPAYAKILEIDPRRRSASWTGIDEPGRCIAEATARAIKIKAHSRRNYVSRGDVAAPILPRRLQSMAKVIFYEKPGCANNAHQKALLAASGHQLDVRNLLTQTWTQSALRRFFGAKPVAAWFNPASPRLKSGEVQPDALSGPAALAMMIADPLLIRRPLMQVGERCESGFDSDAVDQWIGLRPAAAPVGDQCVRTAARDQQAEHRLQPGAFNNHDH